MSGVPLGAWLAIVAAVVVLAVDGWVYSDARERMDAGRPAEVTIGTLRVDTPLAWFLGCVVLWIFFVPLYLTATDRNPFRH